MRNMLSVLRPPLIHVLSLFVRSNVLIGKGDRYGHRKKKTILAEWG